MYKKITNKNKRKCWHGFGDWCFVINTAQLFCVNGCIWCPINSLECQAVILELMASAAFGKQKPKENLKFYRILHFITFLLIYSLWGFPWKQFTYKFFSRGHQWRFGVTLMTNYLVLERIKHIIIAESQFFEPSREMKIGRQNQRVQVVGVKLQCSTEDFWFEL